MKKLIQSLCPCGFSESLGSMIEAVAAIQLHFEQFHKDLLPFGLTEKEALELLTVKSEKEPFQKSVGMKKQKTKTSRSKSTIEITSIA